jgi:hypothetical protein
MCYVDKDGRYTDSWIGKVITASILLVVVAISIVIKIYGIAAIGVFVLFLVAGVCFILMSNAFSAIRKHSKGNNNA